MRTLFRLTIVLPLSMLFLNTYGQSEESLSLFREGLSWRVSSFLPPSDYTEYNYVFSGDTIINDKQYKKLLRDGKYYCAFRKESNRYYMEEAGEDILAYDFDAKVGTEHKNSEMTFRIMSVDTIEVRGRYLRRFDVGAVEKRENGTEDVYFVHRYVEGVGCMLDIAQVAFAPYCIGRIFKMELLKENGQIIFTYDDFNREAFTGETTKITDVPHTNNHPVYDLQGRRLNSKPHKGLYIKDGRKISVSE